MQTKKDLREETSKAVMDFLKSGGKVTECKSPKRKVRNPANGHQKMGFSFKEPPLRIVSSWGLVDGRF